MTETETRPAIDLDALRAYFEQQDDILFALLFGSQARGTAGPLSDVDVAVMLPDEMDPMAQFRRRLVLMGELASLLRKNDVDVAVMNDASLALGYRVYRDGELLACRARSAFVASKGRTISEYLDFLPLLERMNKTVIRRAARGDLIRGRDAGPNSATSNSPRREPN